MSHGCAAALRVLAVRGGGALGWVVPSGEELLALRSR
jgi:hypothetical protein